MGTKLVSPQCFLLRVAFFALKGPFSGTICSGIIPFGHLLGFSHLAAVQTFRRVRREPFVRGVNAREKAGKGTSGS